MNFYNHHNSVSFKSHSIRVTFKICAVLGAQGIRATGFKRAQGNAHCAKFESHTNRVTFETNAIRMTSSVQALYWKIMFKDFLPACIKAVYPYELCWLILALLSSNNSTTSLWPSKAAKKTKRKIKSFTKTQNK